MSRSSRCSASSIPLPKAISGGRLGGGGGAPEGGLGGGFGGCTINLVKDELYDNFIATAKEKFNAKYGHEPKVYDVVISDGSRRLE